MFHKKMRKFQIPGDIHDAEYDLEAIKLYLTDEAKQLLKKSSL